MWTLSLAIVSLLTLSVSTGSEPCVSPDYLARVMFVESDGDGDGILHLAEMIDVFRVYDADGNGYVTNTEYILYQTQNDPELHGLANELYKFYDVTQDNRLQADDYVLFYKVMDSDDDDSVTAIEFITFWVKLFNDVQHLSTRICGV